MKDEGGRAEVGREEGGELKRGGGEWRYGWRRGSMQEWRDEGGREGEKGRKNGEIEGREYTRREEEREHGVMSNGWRKGEKRIVLKNL